VGIGSCLPELIFSLKAVRTKHDELALGDILGTVIIDATIILGIMALINPFNFNPIIIHSTGIILFLSGILVVLFLKSGKILSKKEGIILLIFYILSLVVGFFANKVF
jgi:cation:H+ antiporter